MSAPAPRVICSASGLVVRYGTQSVLDHATISIQEGERIGLLGRNGTGKSTFLRIAAGALEPDAGEFTRRNGLVTGYMPQLFGLEEEATVHANILAGAPAILAMIAEYENATDDGARSAHLLERIQHMDGWNLEHRARSLIMNLHAPDEDRLVNTLSGGEKRRVALCAALIGNPDFLILDEPTNHLDTGSIEWLEEFLARYPGTCLFVTHDRFFLDRVATRIIELSRGGFDNYEGNYTDFLLARAARRAGEEIQERKRQKYLKRELEWVRRGPQGRRTKSVDRIERYFEDAAKEAPEPELDVDLIIPPAPKLANRVIELVDVAAAIGPRTLFEHVSFDLAAKERLGIVGRNGLGKSTLLKLILGQMEPAAGEVRIGSRTQINYVDQNRMALDDAKTVWDEVGEGSEHVALGEESITLRGYLRRFLFTEDRINSKIGLLSGGERSRVLLAKILKRGGNVLVLDEPTNDLDLGTLRLLEEALVGFGGSVIVVSHDRYFLNRVCTSILAFEGAGAVRYFVGNYDYYLEKRSATVAVAAPKAAAAPAPPARPSRKLKWKEERELEGMEGAILAAETEAARLQEVIATGAAADWQSLDADLRAAHDKVAKLYARWEELAALQKPL